MGGTWLDEFLNSKFGSADLIVEILDRSAIPVSRVEELRMGLASLLSLADSLGLNLVAINIAMAIDALPKMVDSAGSCHPIGSQQDTH